MKLTLFTATLLLTGGLYASQTSHKTATQEGMQAIQLLGKTLKTQLKEKLHLDSNGTAAITFCSTQAQNITQQVNDILPPHVKVRRTSLDLRSPANIADATDINMMNRYKTTLEKHPKAVMIPTRVRVGETTRIYKPLLVGAVCLQCHGENISPAIATMIKERYPADRAIGMKLGDFRGVIVAEVAKP